MISEVKTVVDRIEGDFLVCSDDDTMGERLLARRDFPHIKVNDVLLLVIEENGISSVTVLKEETEQRFRAASERLQRLFDRRKNDRS